MLETGSLVDGKYRILREVGHGSMGIVYMAINERANKTWAIKEVRRDGVRDFQVVKQGLIVETDMLKRLSHPHLPSIVDVIEGDDTFLIVMDYIEGRTLKDIMDEHGPQSQEDVADWAKQLCDVLHYLHTRRPPIVYRDMKPSNVMLKPNGDVVLFDFGTAREYKLASQEDTVILGTRGYAAPEQYGGHGQTDPRTDIYCLGATMYHLVTGHNPTRPPYAIYPIRQWNQYLSAGLEEIILKCTRDNPAERYQSCPELLYDLEHYRDKDAGIETGMKRKIRLFAVTAGLAAVCGMGALVFRHMETAEKANTYESYIANAEAVTGEEKIGYYKKAISLDPARSQAWKKLLEEFTFDFEFTSEEQASMNAIQIAGADSSGKNTNAEQFAGGSDEGGYIEFCYQLGIAYYYEAGGTAGSKSTAKAYFDIVKDSGYESEDFTAANRSRALCLSRICDYYDKLGKVDLTGDSLVSYREYWDDMTDLLAGDLVEADNASTAIIMYQELAGRIVTNCPEFRRDGVTEDEMLYQLDNIASHLDSDFNDLTDDIIRNISDERSKLETALVNAGQQVLAVYESRENDLKQRDE